MSTPGWGLVQARGLGYTRNGLPPARAYVYRGELTLEVELPYLCPGGCGRRLESLAFGPCAVCRDAEPPRRRAGRPRVQCPRCRSKPGGERCKRLCG